MLSPHGAARVQAEGCRGARGGRKEEAVQGAHPDTLTAHKYSPPHPPTRTHSSPSVHARPRASVRTCPPRARTPPGVHPHGCASPRVAHKITALLARSCTHDTALAPGSCPALPPCPAGGLPRACSRAPRGQPSCTPQPRSGAKFVLSDPKKQSRAPRGSCCRAARHIYQHRLRKRSITSFLRERL